jgi:hypothetical protein
MKLRELLKLLTTPYIHTLTSDTPGWIPSEAQDAGKPRIIAMAGHCGMRWGQRVLRRGGNLCRWATCVIRILTIRKPKYTYQ